MELQMFVWVSVMILLCVILVINETMKSRKRLGKPKIFELKDEFDIYDWEED